MLLSLQLSRELFLCLSSLHAPRLQVIAKCCDLLRKEQALDERLFKTLPDSHVVRGSCKMNALSGTNAFGMQVVR